MPNYSKAKIYKLTGGGLMYIGHTTRKLSIRFSQHKSQPLRSVKDIIYCDDCKIELLEDYPCDTKEDVCIREQYWIDQFSTTNKQKAFQPMTHTEWTNKVWAKNNPDKFKNYQATYHAKNPGLSAQWLANWKERTNWNYKRRVKRALGKWLADLRNL